MDMDMSGSDDDGPLSPAGLNMTNSTVMSDFLDEVLADDDFMPINTAMARTFWYGMVIVIAVAAMTNLIYQIKTRARWAKETMLYCETSLIAVQTTSCRRRKAKSDHSRKSILEMLGYYHSVSP